MDKTTRSPRERATKKSAQPEESNAPSTSTPTLPIRPQRPKRLHRQGSAVSLASRASASKRARMRPEISRTNSNVSVKYLQIPAADDSAITSGEETTDSVLGESSIAKIVQPSDQEPEAPLLTKPSWTVRHRVYLDNALLSCTTSTQRAGYHKFADFLLREQIEIRLCTGHDGRDAHFATRHAILRFWKSDGSLAEKWMDKDFANEEREHEFAMENLNDWTILHLAMGAEEQRLAEESDDEDGSSDAEPGDTTMEDNSENIVVENADADTGAIDQTEPDNDEGEAESSGIVPTMDITSHYLSSYYDARRIASAPGHATSDSPSQDSAEESDDETENKSTNFHWVEERRRNLENQLQTHYNCTTPSCSNNGGTCISLSATQPTPSNPYNPRQPLSRTASASSQMSQRSQQTQPFPPLQQQAPHHLQVTAKDLTDWSQQIAHANRSVAATTLHLAAKLIDDETRDEDRRLAESGKERADEDDLGEAVRRMDVLGILRPGS